MIRAKAYRIVAPYFHSPRNIAQAKFRVKYSKYGSTLPGLLGQIALVAREFYYEAEYACFSHPTSSLSTSFTFSMRTRWDTIALKLPEASRRVEGGVPLN